MMKDKLTDRNHSGTGESMTQFQFPLQIGRDASALLVVAAAAICLVLSASVNAQEAPVPETGNGSVAEDAATAGTNNTTEIEALKQRIEALEASVNSPKTGDKTDSAAEIEALKQTVEAQAESIETLEMDALQKTQDEQKKLKLYGFMDVRWFKTIFYQNEKNWLDGMVNGHNTFVAGHWNLFVERQLTDSFRAMGEVRFLFQPLGQSRTWTASGFADPYGNQFERLNTRAEDHPDAYYFNWGGISMERIWIEYRPSDYFGIKAGKFLTPYSMWNVDHSPTVIIPIHTPYVITGKYIPLAQTGLYLFGRAFPSNNLTINYGLTLSNGEGPTAEFYDLDDKKALGAHLAFSYDGPVKLDMGAYGYMGDYTDFELRINTYDPFVVNENITVAYKNKAFSTNLKFEWKGLLLQGEYMRSRIRYQDGKRIHGANPLVDEYYPDCIQWATYALLGYRLPFDAISIMPFVMYEYVQPPESADTPRGHLYGGGINWRINPFAVFKVEFYHQKTVDIPEIAGDMPMDYHVINTQLAVTY